MRPRRVAAEGGTRRHVTEDGALSRDPCAIADHEMIGYSHMSCQDRLITDVSAPRDPHPCHDQAALPNSHVVPDLNQVVDLGAAAHHCVINTPAVDAGVRADFHVIFENAAAHVRDSDMASVAREVPESISSDHGSRLQHYPIAQLRPGIAHRTGSKNRVVSYHNPVSQRDMISQPGPRPDPHIVPDDGVGSNRDISTQDRSLANAGSRINPWSRCLIREERANDPDECVIRICNDDSGARASCPAREALGNQDGARAGAPEVSSVATRCGKGESIGAGTVQRPDTLNAHTPIAKQAATDEIGDRLRGETRVRHAPSCLL